MPADQSGNRRWPKRLRKGLILLVFVLLIVCVLAHLPPVINFVWQRSRGTRFEPHATRWAIANFDREKHPVEVALARNRIREGQTVDDVMANHGPFHVSVYGNYQSLEPIEMAEAVLAIESYSMIAKDGRQRCAHWWTCTGHLEFFNTLSNEEETEFVGLRREFYRKRNEARLAAQMAIAGSVLHTSIYDIPQPIPEGKDERAEEP